MSMSVLVISMSSIQAQIKITTNIGSQPLWAPVGYNHVDYYYLPDVESYYSVPRQQYVYQDGGSWVYAKNLPSKYSNYDVNKGYKVVLNEPEPFLHFNNDKVKYAKFKGYKEHQEFIQNSNDPRYFIIKGHPKYQGNNKYGNKHDGIMGHQNNGNGNGKGYKNDNGKIKNNKFDNDDDRDNKSGKGKIKNNKSDNDDDRENKSGEGKIKNNKSDNDDDRGNKSGKGKIKNNKSDNDDDRDNKSGEGKIKNNKPDNDDARENRSDIGRNKQMGNKGKGNKKD